MAGYSEVAPFAVAFQDTFYTASYSHLVSVSLLTALTNISPPLIGFRQNTDPWSTDPLLTPYKINGKMKIKKAQNYQWDPIQVHQ